jgi:hypothetical protein
MGTIREWICALKYPKKKGGGGNLEEVGFWVFVGKIGNGGGGGGKCGPAVVRGGEEWPAVVCRGWVK